MLTSQIVVRSAPEGGAFRPIRRAWFGGFLLGALALGAAACSDDADVAADKLQHWRENGPVSYTYVVETSCFCPAVEPVRVVVKDGVVVQAVGVSSGVPRFDQGGTMTELLESALRMAKGDPDQFEARYEPGLGYLLRLDVDQRDGWADDEVSISVSCFSESTDAEACPLPTVSSCDGTFRAIDPMDPLRRTCPDGSYPQGRREGSEEVCCGAS